MMPSDRWSLYDLEAFAPLEAVAKEFDVAFTLVGGAASRAAMALHLEQQQPDLVELAPFTSDLDLHHSGAEELTPRIAEAIDVTAPQAPWCRWSIAGRDRSREHAIRRAQSTEVPLRAVTFGEEARPLPDAFKADVDALRVTLLPRAEFHPQPLKDLPEDLEIFGLLLAFAAAQDLRLATGRLIKFDERQARGMVARYIRGDRQRLQDNPAHRQRLRYMMAPLVARPLPEFGRDVLNILASALTDAPQITTDRALVVSAALEPDVYRCDTRVAFAKGAGAAAHLEAILKAQDARLDPVFDVAGLSDAMVIRPGEALSTGDSDDVVRREFVHLAWAPPDDLGDSYLGALAFARAGGKVTLDDKISTVGGQFPEGAAWIRMDISDLPKAEDMSLQVAALSVAARRRREREYSAMPKPLAPSFERDELDRAVLLDQKAERLAQLHALQDQHQLRLEQWRRELAPAKARIADQSAVLPVARPAERNA